MASNKQSLTIVVNGTPTEVDANVNAPLRSIIGRALEQTGNAGQPPDNWVLKDQHGVELNLDNKIESFGFDAQTKLFLSLRAGIGG